MPPRNRQRGKSFTTPPPVDLPDDDPYGDVPPPAPTPVGEGRAETPPTPRASVAEKPKKRTKQAQKKPPAVTDAEAASPPDTPSSATVPVKDKVQVQLYIPAALHNAIADYKAEHWRGNEAPTYAQLSVWACEDHRDEVLERAVKIHQLRHGSTGDVRGDRSPRGTRKARPQVPIGPRYSPGDERFLEEMAAAAGPVDGDPVRRTTLVAAALAVAVKHDPIVREEPAAEPEDEFFG